MDYYYAGIGSRDTPQEYLRIISLIGRALAKKGWILRSGAANGADKSFEYGCDSAQGNKEIYLPYRGFERSNSDLHPDKYPFTEAEIKISKAFHPRWDRLSEFGTSAMKRNVRQLRGLAPYTKNKRSKFIVCWTKDGLIAGGTGQALRLAGAMDIKVFNLGSCKSTEEINVLLNSIDQYQKEIKINAQ